MSSFGTFSIFIFILLLFHNINCDFPTDFLGNYLTDKDYNKKSFCQTEVCMIDSDRLIYAADHDSNKTSPCTDFKTFSMGTFFEHRVVNDRYTHSGFDLDVHQQHFEKQKALLLRPDKDDDPKMFSAIKKFFRLCINSSKNYVFLIIKLKNVFHRFC